MTEKEFEEMYEEVYEEVKLYVWIDWSIINEATIRGCCRDAAKFFEKWKITPEEFKRLAKKQGKKITGFMQIFFCDAKAHAKPGATAKILLQHGLISLKSYREIAGEAA